MSVKKVDVLPRNHFNKKRNRSFPSAFIINTDDWPGVGGVHWVAVWFDRYKRAIFFDSLGKHPSHYKFQIKPYQWNKKCYQGESDLCGEYSLFFIMFMIRGADLKWIQRRFSKDKRKNDAYIRSYFYRLKPCCGPSNSTDVDQTCKIHCHNGGR